MKRVILLCVYGVFYLLNMYPQLIKNDFLAGYSIGDALEKASYTSESEEQSTFSNTWCRAQHESWAQGGESPKIVSPLYYNGYAESGTNAFEQLRIMSSGARVLGFSLTDKNDYSSGTYYLTFLINMNSNTIVGTGSGPVQIIGFDGRFTIDFQRVFLTANVLEMNSTYQFGIAEKSQDKNLPYQFSDDILSFGQTYIVVLKYDFETKQAALFINPAITETEPSPKAAITISDNSANSLKETGIRGIALHQRTNHGEKIGGIRFATTWKAAIGLDNTSSSLDPQRVNHGELLRTEYFSLSGIQETLPVADKLYITKNIYEDGAVIVSKTIYR